MNEIKVSNSGVKNKPFVVSHGGYLTLSNGDKMYIHTGYTFDNGSIPKIFKFFYDTFGWEFFNYREKAFLVHDFLYNYRGYQQSPEWRITPIDRAFADHEMAHYMTNAGDSVAKVRVFFIAVRLFGWISFGKI